MPRYVRQRDMFRCGPVGILNALKWAGSPATQKDIRALCVESNCTPPNGTLRTGFGHALKTAGKDYFRARKETRPRLRDIERHVRDGGAVLVCYLYSHTVLVGGKKIRAGHYFLITGVSRSGKTFRVVNYDGETGHLPNQIRRHTLRHDLVRRKRQGTWYPCVWHLQKRRQRLTV